MEFKSYGEVDVNETPIVVLGCAHFFTGETLDGLVGMGNVYTTDKLGAYDGLNELSGELMAVPACPDCRIPIRQFATRRYNRVINKAVLDETSKRFLVSGRQRLDALEKLVAAAENELVESRANAASAYLDLRKSKPDRHTNPHKLDKETAQLRQEMGAEHQPTKKLFDAVVTFQRRERKQQSVSQKMQQLNISQPSAHSTVLQPVYDQQITLGAHRLQLRIQEAMLRDIFALLSKGKRELVPTSITGGSPDKRCAQFLSQCASLIPKATAAKLPRLVIPTCLAYARIAQLTSWYQRTVATTATTTTTEGTKQPDTPTTTETAREFLATAQALCATFPGGSEYEAELAETMRLFEGPRYETVTPEEIAAIKAAMVSGPGGLATHSGHWYTCRNGHSVSILHPLILLWKCVGC